MPIDYANGGDAIVASSEIKSVVAFEGKSIAFKPLSPSEFLLNYAQSTKDMIEKDVTPVNMPPEGVPAAMVSATLPVGATYEPNVPKILARGGGKKFHGVYSSHDAPGLTAHVLVFDQKQIDAKPKQIDALIRSDLDAYALDPLHRELSP